MARKHYFDEGVLKLLREIDDHLHDGLDVVSACRNAGISDNSFYYWRKKFGSLSRSQVSEMKSLKASGSCSDYHYLFGFRHPVLSITFNICLIFIGKVFALKC